MTDVRIDFAETLATTVGCFLQREYPHIAFADMSGESSVFTEEDRIGFLDNNSVSRFWRWQKIFPTPRRHFLGVLWFSNETVGTTKNKWVLEVYGQKNMDFLREVSDILTNRFGVVIRLKLMSRDIEYEILPTDYNI